MNSKTISARVKALLEIPLAYFLIATTLWFAGVMSGSAALAVLCSLLVFALPFIYVAAVTVEAKKNEAEHAVRTKASGRSVRVSLTAPSFNGA